MGKKKKNIPDKAQKTLEHERERDKGKLEQDVAVEAPSAAYVMTKEEEWSRRVKMTFLVLEVFIFLALLSVVMYRWNGGEITFGQLLERTEFLQEYSPEE